MTTTETTPYVAELLARRDRLERLLVEVEAELAAVEDGLRVAGISRRGRPRARPTHTPTEAREAHRLHQLGERTPWVLAGEREFKRRNKRTERSGA